MSNRRHYTAAITAFTIWGFFPITLRLIQSYNAGEILYFRILFSCIILLALILAFKRRELNEDWQTFKTLIPKERTRTIALTLAGGILLTVNWLTFIYTVNAINLKTASFSYLICPVITAVLGYLLLKERLTILQWIAVALCAVSCILTGINSALELGYSVLTALTYALYLISQRKNQGFDRLISLGVQILFSFVLLNFSFKYLISEIPDSSRFYLIIAIIAVVFTVLPLFLNLFALNRVSSATVGVLMYLNPVINFFVAFVVLNESVNSIQFIGYSIIVIALIIFNYPNFRRLGSVLR